MFFHISFCLTSSSLLLSSPSLSLSFFLVSFLGQAAGNISSFQIFLQPFKFREKIRFFGASKIILNRSTHSVTKSNGFLDENPNTLRKGDSFAC